MTLVTAASFECCMLCKTASLRPSQMRGQQGCLLWCALMQKLHCLQRSISQPVDCDVCWLIGALIVMRGLYWRGLHSCPLCLALKQSVQWRNYQPVHYECCKCIDALVVASFSSSSVHILLQQSLQHRNTQLAYCNCCRCIDALVVMGVLVPGGDRTAVRRTAEFFLKNFEVSRHLARDGQGLLCHAA